VGFVGTQMRKFGNSLGYHSAKARLAASGLTEGKLRAFDSGVHREAQC